MNILSNSEVNYEFDEYLSKNNIRHLRIPVYSPWQGSFYERMIKTTKSCLQKVLGRKQVDYFELLTLLSDIQEAINSRPLTYVDIDDITKPQLTPNSFLKPFPGRSVVFGQESGSEVPKATRKTLVNSLNRREDRLEFFKDIWYNEYLLSLREASRNLYQTPWEKKWQSETSFLLTTLKNLEFFGRWEKLYKFIKEQMVK